MGIDAPKSIVLVVDDAPENIDVLKAILTPEHVVKAATNGEAALASARREPHPDIVLLDVVMPGMSGLDVCRALKSDEATRGIPVMFVTSRNDPTDESAGFAVGAVDYIHKPVNPHVVRARVRTHLDLNAARHDLEQQNEVLRENARLREEVEAISRHDLKNPLTAILWAASIILESPEMAERDRALARTITDSGRKILEMVNRTIDLVKMERGTYVLKVAYVDVLRLARQVADAQVRNAERNGGGIDILLDGAPPAVSDTFVVKGEELLVYSMLGNLVTNAVEASPEGSRVVVSLTRGQRGMISIHNAGCIPEAIRPRFMEKFATSGKERGNGLGAYSARLIATTLGGETSWESTAEKGTTITVRLPV
jgi:two-component system, sensor histidine kinase and response regulator